MPQAKNQVFGMEPLEVEVNAGAFFWGAHLKNPTIHRVSTNERNIQYTTRFIIAIHMLKKVHAEKSIAL